MRDLPSGATLLARARNVLMNEVVPLLPEERRSDALLIARCVTIAEREAETGTTSEHEFRVLCGADIYKLLHRFDRELRIGAFENSLGREISARAILWRLSVAKLRQSNPQFLAAHRLDLRAAWLGE